jgi:acetyl esterase/lipase
MSSPRCFQATYKHVDEQQIDVDVYLPSSQNAKSPVCTSATISKYIWAYCHRAVINIHGGAFMLGSSKMVNKDQVQDCLSRGWIVLAPNHRLCPQVDLLNGPIQDCRDLLAWVYDGGLERGINDTGQSTVIPDTDHVFAFGTSSGGTLALCLVSYRT